MQKYNFSAGPSVLPKPVIGKLSQNYHPIMELVIQSWNFPTEEKITLKFTIKLNN